MRIGHQHGATFATKALVAFSQFRTTQHAKGRTEEIRNAANKMAALDLKQPKTMPERIHVGSCSSESTG